jgi:hypothetical protein
VPAKQAWENYPELWKDEKAFMQYLRGAFRSIWSNYPAKHVWKKAQMVPTPPDFVGRAKTIGRCAFCKERFAASKLEVDHREQAGSFSNKEEAVEWFWRLLDTNDNWQLTCKPCHKIKSLQERNEGMSFEDARVQKEIIRLTKKENKQEMLDILKASGVECKNQKERKEALKQILSKDITKEK